MKRYLISFLALLFSAFIYSQPFVITPEGLRSRKDESKDFVVIGHKEKTAQELYSIGKQYIMKTVNDPSFSIKADNSNAYLRYSLYIPEIFSFSRALVNLQVDAKFDVEMAFKDGRIRYRILNLDMKFPKGDKNTTFEIKRNKWGGWAFYDQKDKLYMKNEKQKAEDFINGLLKEFVQYAMNYDTASTGNDNDW